jgi:hypothetical protein
MLTSLEVCPLQWPVDQRFVAVSHHGGRNESQDAGFRSSR